MDAFVDRYMPGANGKVAYRLASMFTHPTTSGAFVFASGGPDGEVELAWDSAHVFRTCRSSMTAWGVANGRLLAYFRWDAPRFDTWWKALGSLERSRPAQEQGAS